LGDGLREGGVVAAKPLSGDKRRERSSAPSPPSGTKLDFYGRSRRVRGNDLSDTVKLVTLLGQYMQDNYQGRYYAKAQNLSRVLCGVPLD
jgi:hypothetical protein